MSVDHVVVGVRPETGKAPDQYGTDRLCEREGCTTVLSRYNPTHYCAQHTSFANPFKPKPKPVKRGKRGERIW